MRLYAAFLAALLSAAPIAYAQEDNELSRHSLQGLNGVRVIIEDIPSEIEQNYGLTSKTIRTDVELKLRQAGIQVLPAAGLGPYLYVRASLNARLGPRAFVIEVQLRQSAMLLRDPSILVPVATTWTAGVRFGIVPENQIQTLRDDIKDKVDVFINAYLAVNPKK